MKKLRWERLGKIFDPSGRSDWMHNYAQNPNVLELDDRLRIFFTTRPKRGEDGKMVSNTAFADFTKDGSFSLIGVAEKPVITLGGVGTFDEFGIMPGSVVKKPASSDIYLYYVGWSRSVSVPYQWRIGLATSSDNGKTFRKYSNGPLLGLDETDPYLLACPRVYYSKDVWTMYYESGLGWNEVEGYMESVYQTRMAISDDGLNWKKSERILFDEKVDFECQTSPCVLRFEDSHYLLFSFRHGVDFRNQRNGYQLGCAVSQDGVNWTRRDDLVGFQKSEKGWDSEMVCYPDLFQLKGETYMFYCGNYFGEAGFGVAKLTS